MSKQGFSAVEYATPVRPLVGHARHAVWGGETPPEQIRSASYAWWRRQGRTAKDALALMRADVAAGTVRFPRHHPDANPDLAAYGERRLRWIENPGALGLRSVGLAHEIGRAHPHCNGAAVSHTGWFVDPDGHGEVVCGVVYQMSGRDGRARYLAGYADSWNCDKDGRGPALLCLEPMVGESVDTKWCFDSILREAARRGDRIAERMAKEERTYAEAHEAGRVARQSGREMRKVASRYTGAVRAVRAVFRNRHAIEVADARLVLNVLAGQVRRLLADLEEARAVFRKRLNSRDDWAWADNHGWSNGYSDG